MRNIQAGNFDFPSPWWDDVSEDAVNLIKRLMVREPFPNLYMHTHTLSRNLFVIFRQHLDAASRPVAKDILSDPWMQKDSAILSAKDLGGAQQELKKFNAKRKLNAGFKMARALVAMKNKRRRARGKEKKK